VSEIKVLLVEDQAIAQKLAKIILGSLECHCDIANTGSEAVEYFLQKRYDLILMDIGLPDKDGYTVSQEMRAIEKQKALLETPILGLSAHSAQTGRDQSLTSGMNGYLVKPLTVGMCEGILKQFVLSHKKMEEFSVDLK
jgi:CheY-like chemotaxis protein